MYQETQEQLQIALNLDTGTQACPEHTCSKRASQLRHKRCNRSNGISGQGFPSSWEKKNKI